MEDLLITVLAIIITLTPFLILAKLELKLEEKNNKRRKKIFILSGNNDRRSREEIMKLAKIRRLEAEIRNRRS